MDDTELFAIWQEAGSPKNARRALFDAGRRAERDGDDLIVKDETDDYLAGLPNYLTRSAERMGKVK